MNICDKAGKSAENARTCLKAVVRKLFNSDPHVGLKAVTVCIVTYHLNFI